MAKAKNKRKPVPKKVAKKQTQKKPAKKIAKSTAPKKAKTVAKTASKSGKSGSAPKTRAANKIQTELHLLPLADRLVVLMDGPSEKTAGGLYIPASVEDRPRQGKVLAVGPGSKSKKGSLKPLDVKAGESVLFNSYAGVKTSLDGQEVLILREEDVLGVVSK